MVTYIMSLCSIFHLCGKDIISDEWCVFNFYILIFVSFYSFVITSSEVFVGKCCWMKCDNKRFMQQSVENNLRSLWNDGESGINVQQIQKTSQTLKL